MLHLTRASLLAVLMMWFGTHHIAPHFLHHPLHLLAHAHNSCCNETTEFKTTTPQMQHCEFCISGGIVVPQLENNLPRVEQVSVRPSIAFAWFVARVIARPAARAPPLVVSL
jgi:hypothetical protein